tara:strand:+ start:4039 stop:4227 length:189 start_codon:yes stop_codon:yes gene_type:complete
MTHKIFKYNSEAFPDEWWISEILKNLNGTLISHQFIFFPAVYKFKENDTPAMWVLSVMLKEN